MAASQPLLVRKQEDLSKYIQYPTMALAVLDVPPLTIPSLQPTSEFIDWSSPHKINPVYIDEVKAGIHRKFPPKKYRWSQSLFPAKDLKTSIFAKLGDSYNPFLLRLPYGIQCTTNLISTRYIMSSHSAYQRPHEIKDEVANEKYLDFLREYHLLYVDVLEAINGSSGAFSRIAEKLDTTKMYDNADIDPQILSTDSNAQTASLEFRQSCLAHISLDILRSPVSGIGTGSGSEWMLSPLRLRSCLQDSNYHGARTKNQASTLSHDLSWRK